MKTKKLTTTGLLLAVSVLLPQLFHLIGGPAMGRVFLPMHLGVFLAGLIVGGWQGMMVGVLAPLISFAITGMPQIPVLFFMIFELAVYGAVCGFVKFSTNFEQKKLSIVPKLLIAMIAGRIAGGIAMWGGAILFSLNIQPIQAVLASITVGIPGIALQIILIPTIYILLKRGGFLLESRKLKTDAR